MEGPDPGTETFVVEPGRLLEVLEEIAQRTRRELQNLVVLLYAGPDKPVQVAWRQLCREFLHYRVELGIADGGMFEIIVGSGLIVETGLFVAVEVSRRLCRRHCYHRRGRVRSHGFPTLGFDVSPVSWAGRNYWEKWRHN